MVTVQLHNVIFSGRHGVFKEELATGNTFEVNLDVSYDESEHPFSGLDSIVNYVVLFGIIKDRMHQPSPLLEKIADQEKIEVGDEEINREVEALAEQSKQPVESIRARLTQEGVLDRIRNRIRNEKTLDYLYHQSA